MSSATLSPRTKRAAAAAAVGLATLALTALSGCKDEAKISAQKAGEHVAALAALATKDVGEIERGLPQGAKFLAGTIYAKGADPKQDLAGIRPALRTMTQQVPDLMVAKSTFFAIADETGVAIRNNLETDVMAGQNVVTIFPDLQKAVGGEFVTTVGLFPAPPDPRGPARDWVAAAPIQDAKGKLEGLLVTGWTYRRFANHLQESLSHDLKEALRKSGDTGKLPILYVFVFDKSGVYGAPLTPAVNEKALADADPLGKTSGGAFQGNLTITDRVFGLGVARVPKLGPDTGVAVLESEI